MSIRVYGFEDSDLHRVRDAIAEIIGLRAQRGDNADWGEHYWFDAAPGQHHHLVENLPSARSGMMRDAPEPEFIQYLCIFYTGTGRGSSRLTSALLAIGGTLLMPLEDRFHNWHGTGTNGEPDHYMLLLNEVARPMGKLH